VARYFGSDFVSEEEAVGSDAPDDGVGGFGVDVAEQQLGTTGFGAPTPAMSEPSPSFCRVGASSLPLESSPFAD